MATKPLDRVDSPAAARIPSPEKSRSNRLPARLFALLCIVFGLMHIVNLHPIGDGLWFWYARLLREGHRLYHDLYFNQQPFFVLVTLATQSIFGLSWLAGKIPAVLELLLYVAGLYWLSLYAPVRAWTRGLLISAAFLLTMAMSYARFDDYHYPSYIAVVFSALLLLRYYRRETVGGEWWTAALLAVLGAISLGNRLNDGAALVAAQFLILPFFLRRRRVAATALYCVVVLVTLLSIVLITGDNLGDWARESIFKAAAIKGGSGTVLIAPFLYPFHQIAVFLTDRYQAIVLVLTVVLLSLLAYALRARDKAHTWRTRRALYGAALFVVLFAAASPWLRYNELSLIVGNLFMLIGVVVVVVLLARTVRQLLHAGVSGVNPLPLLLLLPFLQAASAAMTSAKSNPDVDPAVGMMLVLLPITVPVASVGLSEAVLASAAFVLTIYGFPMKYSNPYQWHHYYSVPMFTEREWYRHPLYGPMYLEHDQLQLMTAMCARIQSSDKKPELLSMPFPYPNYFCGVEPWHGHVQTWYDTASRATVEKLTADLERDPPEWIAYERGLDTMGIHEHAFLHDTKLPHRQIDALIVNRVLSGAWTLTLQRCYGGADWMLVHTRPARPGEASDTLIPSNDYVNLCDRTEHTLKLP